MKLTHLTINNCLTIGTAHLELDDRGLLLIQGDNQDDTSAKSNGAGKSSIVDALSWNLFGETARGVSGDDIVNETAKKDCYVFSMWNDDGTEYKIERFRKDSKFKNQLMVWQIDGGGPSIDLSKGTDKETQEVVNKIIGCGVEVFNGAVYAGQEAMPDLPGMTDKQLKLLIEEAAGVSELAEAYARASKLSNTAATNLTVASTALSHIQKMICDTAAAVVVTTADMDIFEGQRKDKARAELAKIKPFEDGKLEAHEKLAKMDGPALELRQKELNDRLAAHKSYQADLAAKVAFERSVGNRVTELKTRVTQEKQRIERQEKELSDIASQVGKPCGECGKPYHEHDLEGAKDTRQANIATAKTALLNTAKDYKSVLTEWADATQAVEDYKKTMPDVSEISAELSDIGGKLITRRVFADAIKSMDRDIDAVKLAAKAKLTEVNPWTKAVESKKADLEKLELDLKVKSAQVEELTAAAELYADAAKVFGPAGVRAHILDTVTPFLNEKTGEYLGALADGNIHASWNTLSKTAKGELREKFNIEVSNDKGAKSFKGLSGGEKRKVRLAAAMALQDMVASRATKPINLFIADEVDHALDDAGLERLMSVLDKKSKERGTVLVISHNSLSDWIDNVITVTKSGGISTVTGATHRGF